MDVKQQLDNDDSYCPDRRTVLAALGLFAGGLFLESSFPASADAKRYKTRYYSIVYKLNGGKFTSKPVKYIKRGKALKSSELKKPRLKGYRFSGWYADAKFKHRAFLLKGNPNRAKRTVSARWKPVHYSITYHLKGGVAARKQPARYTIESEQIIFAKPKRKGYVFLGWYGDPHFTKKKRGIKAGSTGNVTVYARWKRIKYSIEYDLRGGKPSIALPKSYTVKSNDIVPLAPTKDGYRFAGWYSDSKLQNAVASIPAGSTGNIKLYAKWEPIDYWNAHLVKRCARVCRVEQKLSDPIPSFIFITDMHLPTNALVSPQLVRQVVASTGVGMVVFGGDVLNTPVSRTDAVHMLRYVRKAFDGRETHMVRGNHDGNCRRSNKESDDRIDAEDFIKLTKHKSEVRDNGCVYCYRDDAKHHVRYLFLDSGAPSSNVMDQTQLAWLQNRILELDESWTVLVFIHKLFSSSIVSENEKSAVYDPIGKMVRATLDDIYDVSRARIAGIIAGHCHKDIVVYSAKGYPMVSTNCDAYGRGKPYLDYSYKLGTTNEQAFDVVTIDTGRQRLVFTRIGLGNNRVISYAPRNTAPKEDEADPIIIDPIEETDPDDATDDTGLEETQDPQGPLQSATIST